MVSLKSPLPRYTLNRTICARLRVCRRGSCAKGPHTCRRPSHIIFRSPIAPAVVVAELSKRPSCFRLGPYSAVVDGPLRYIASSACIWLAYLGWRPMCDEKFSSWIQAPTIVLGFHSAAVTSHLLTLPAQAEPQAILSRPASAGPLICFSGEVPAGGLRDCRKGIVSAFRLRLRGHDSA